MLVKDAMKANVHGASVATMTVAATGYVIVKSVLKLESITEKKG